MAKFGMSMCVLGMAESTRPTIAFNALWPRPASPPRHPLRAGRRRGHEGCRTVEIMGDAAHAIFEKPARSFSGNFLIDDSFLYAEGERDFDKYRVDRNTPLMADFFVPADSLPPPGVKIGADHGRVRPFAPDDLDGVVALCAAEGWPSFPEDPPRAPRLTRRGDHRRRGDSAAVVGFAQLLSDGEIQAHLSLIAVAVDHRRKGVALAMLKAALASAGGLRIDLLTDTASEFTPPCRTTAWRLPHLSADGRAAQWRRLRSFSSTWVGFAAVRP